MKKQLLMITSVALASFLIGTTLAMAVDGENPFDTIWKAITGLQIEQDALEERVEILEAQISERNFAVWE